MAKPKQPLQLGQENIIPTTDLNSRTYCDYFNRLKSIALVLFKWEGLPDSCNVRFLEETLFTYGKAIFVHDKTLGYMNLKVTPEGKLNVYNEPVRWRAYSTGYSQSFDLSNAVYIRNNYLTVPTASTVELFAYRLYEAERSADVNIKGQKFPRLVRASEKQRLTMQNVYQQYDGNQPVIFTDENLDPNLMGVLNTETPFVADKLMYHKKQIWNEAMTFLGIKNINQEKKERLITTEVESNNELIQFGSHVMLETRQEAADKINKLFGLNVSVRTRTFNDLAEDVNIEEGKEEYEDGDLHD